MDVRRGEARWCNCIIWKNREVMEKAKFLVSFVTQDPDWQTHGKISEDVQVFSIKYMYILIDSA